MKLHFLKQILENVFGQTSQFKMEESAYGRLIKNGFVPDAIIDVGAYEGEWTRMARRVFGEVPCLMVEANSAKNHVLEHVCRSLPLTNYISAILSSTSGEVVTFYQMETGSSFLAEQSNAPRTETTLITRTLDEVASNVTGTSIFLKVDVQGAELLVLAGGQNTLARSSVIQLEVAMLPYNKGAPTFLEVLSYMDKRGFVPLDISGRSTVTGHLVQIDILFTQRESALRPKFIVF